MTLQYRYDKYSSDLGCVQKSDGEVVPWHEDIYHYLDG